MALDGIVMANITAEMKLRLEGGKIAKIAQPEKDELLFTIKNQKNTWRLLISASASLPLLYFTENNKQSPLTAPNFCMLLRKHIGNGRITRISQPGLERIICIDVEHLDELGDRRTKKLRIEIMGKHSNIIFCNDDDMILDSIKHISAQISSIREVLPGRAYFIPNTVEKKDPLTITEDEFIDIIGGTASPIQKALYLKMTGISPIIAHELCTLASLDGDHSANELTRLELVHLYGMFTLMMEDVKKGNFTPNIIFKNEEPVEFSALPLTCFQGDGYAAKSFDSISSLLEFYYASKNAITRIRQKSVDLRKIVQIALDRNYKKYDLQEKQLKDTEKKDKFKIYGELLNTYGYELTGGEKKLTCLNYYTNEDITIPLNDQLSAKENAQKYFDKYNKSKRTFEAVTEQLKETKQEIDHLESVSSSLDIARLEEDLVQIKEELMEYGYVKHRRSGDKKPKITSKPFHYLTSDGFHIYVGKNNYQNEELTFKMANGNDWWFHAKGMPGSHVIVKSEGKDLSDAAYEEAGALAAYYSKGRENDKVEVDYIQRKQIKKVAGAAPGFVIYHTNFSMVAEPSNSLEEIK
ncbi:NFACT RNA binding domain-containing protein [Clostridium sp. E02]|uniref:Rqc2 family fibronectin-binding protein n=1 Tax=Clostridium sp. E02 TaxID=2487134 RepID=UPI000F52F3EA|nr:NFACT RNA binding domain-containing protein [Clostridium sp. E02]